MNYHRMAHLLFINLSRLLLLLHLPHDLQLAIDTLPAVGVDSESPVEGFQSLGVFLQQKMQIALATPGLHEGGVEADGCVAVLQPQTNVNKYVMRPLPQSFLQKRNHFSNNSNEY